MKKTITLVVLAIAFFGALQAWGWLRDNRLPAFDGPAEIFVREDTTPDDVIEQIKSQTTIRWERALRSTFERKKVAQYISPGHYKIEPEHCCVYVARMLNNSWQTPINMTLSGSLRLKSEIARKIGRQMQVDSAEVAAALEDEVFLRKFGFTPTSVFSMIVPDTYEIYWDASLTEIFDKLKKGYDNYWTSDRLALAKAKGLTPAQVSIFASIVQCESNYTPEYPLIAGVYLLRYKRGQKLQADPTIAYCFDYKLDRILKKHLEVNSPYNTYKYKGLPPGPISCPGKAALDAVLSADTSAGYMFFCASPSMDGTHCFARTYKEHLNNAHAFQRELDRRAKNK